MGLGSDLVELGKQDPGLLLRLPHLSLLVFHEVFWPFQRHFSVQARRSRRSEKGDLEGKVDGGGKFYLDWQIWEKRSAIAKGSSLSSRNASAKSSTSSRRGNRVVASTGGKEGVRVRVSKEHGELVANKTQYPDR